MIKNVSDFVANRVIQVIQDKRDLCIQLNEELKRDSVCTNICCQEQICLSCFHLFRPSRYFFCDVCSDPVCEDCQQDAVCGMSKELVELKDLKWPRYVCRACKGQIRTCCVIEWNNRDIEFSRCLYHQDLPTTKELPLHIKVPPSTKHLKNLDFIVHSIE